MNERGSVLIMTIALVFFLMTMTCSYLYAVGLYTQNSGWGETDAKLLNLAEAGLHKAIWNLKTPPNGGGRGENWTQAMRTETLADGQYLMSVLDWNYCLWTNGAIAFGSYSVAPSPNNDPLRAIDGQTNTYWERVPFFPSVFNIHIYYVWLPYPVTLNRIDIRFGDHNTRATDYILLLIGQNNTSTVVAQVTNNNQQSVSHSFVAFPEAYFIIFIAIRTPSGTLRIREIEAPGKKVISAGQIRRPDGTWMQRVIEQTLIADDGVPENQVAYCQPDWREQ